MPPNPPTVAPAVPQQSTHTPAADPTPPVGTMLDVLDTTGKWMQAFVAETDRGAILVHYCSWTCQWDEVLMPNDPRVAPLGTHTYVTGGTLRCSQLVDVYDEHPKQQRWCEATVIEESSDSVKVHFKGWAAKFDTWFRRDSPLIAPFGSHTRMETHHTLRTRRVFIESQLTRYFDALRAQSMIVVPCEGDGNCLFRAVSHQLYGTQEHHRLVRTTAVDYMMAWRAHFSQFTVGHVEYFGEYCAWKRSDGVWGDDPEIQAVSELYDRPVEVYAFHPTRGAAVLNRGFNNAAGGPATSAEALADTRPPIRLSFYGGGHYDSVVGPTFTSGFIADPPGTVEARAIERANALATVGALRPTADADVRATEDSTMAAVLAESRRLFSSKAGGLDAALAAAMEQPGGPETSDTVTSGGGGATSGDAPPSAVEPAFVPLEDRINASVIQSSAAADVEAQLIEAAKRASEEAELAAQMRAIEEDELRRVLAMSVGGVDWVVTPTAAPAPAATDDDDEEMELMRAIAMSYGK